MPFADLINDLSDLTILILGILGFSLALFFQKEIKGLMGRLTTLEWKQATVRAEPTTEPEEPKEQGGLGQEPPEPAEEEETESEATVIRDAVTDDSSESTIRAAMGTAFFQRDRSKGERLFEQLQTKVTDPAEMKRDQARRLAWQFASGLNDSALTELEELSNDDQVASFAYRMIGVCLKEAGRIQEATEAFQESADKAPENSYEKGVAIAMRAESLVHLGDSAQAEKELEELIADATDLEVLDRAWEALADLYEKTDRKELQAVALHKAAELAGNDPRRWFSAAYAYANAQAAGFGALAIHCYNTSLRFDPDRDWALNNLGVELGRMNLPLKAADYYRRASEKGNTLAEANLAERYLNAGFADEAQDLVDKSLQADNPDSKVSRVVADIKEAREAQAKELAEISERGDQAASFMSTFGSARLKDFPSSAVSGNWSFEQGEAVVLNATAGDLEIVWGKKRRHRRFKGRIAGATVLGVFEKEDSWPGSDSITWKSDGAGYAVFGEDPIDMRMLRIATGETEYLRLTKASDA